MSANTIRQNPSPGSEGSLLLPAMLLLAGVRSCSPRRPDKKVDKQPTRNGYVLPPGEGSEGLPTSKESGIGMQTPKGNANQKLV
mmetsp:Transcript_15259/g.23942  ORF Transcript_15259/g.23942 Transcript_15259/m.23942 type:complete len:84 (+) Transcript_15259:879-1130(+)